jgi:dCMP deaminase
MTKPPDAPDTEPLTWTEWLYGHATWAAMKSKDSTRVGAALVDAELVVRLTSYNGPPRGVVDYAHRRTRPQKYLYASHAEANLIAFAAREGIRTKDCTVYVTHMPCAACARTLIQAGIRSVYYGKGVTSMPTSEFETARVMFKESGVTCEEVDV